MVAVDGGGDGDPGQAAADELQHCHLSGGILHGHAVGPQAQVRAAAIDLLAGWVIQVTVDDLLRQGERPPEPGSAESPGSEIVFCYLKTLNTMNVYLSQVFKRFLLISKATFNFVRITGGRSKQNL